MAFVWAYSGRSPCRLTLRAMIAFAMMTGFAPAQKIYFADLNALKRMNTDGTELETLIVSPLFYADGVALDVGAGRLYWGDRTTGSIRRANLDGTDAEIILQTDPPRRWSVGQIALDVEVGKLYWCDSSSYGGSWSGRIGRANLDGSEIEILVPDLGSPISGIAIDRANGSIYGATTSTIARWDMNGDNPDTVVSSAWASHIALDVDAGMIYWTRSNAVERATINGSARTRLVAGLDEPEGIALDCRAGKIYWTNSQTRRVQRANMDGSEVEDFADTISGVPKGIALDEEAGVMYWGAAGRIRRARTDGSDAVDVLIAPVCYSHAMTIDRTAHHIYWTNLQMGEVRRAALNGANVESVISGLTGTWGVTVHASMDVLYAVDFRAQQILRSRRDGSNVEVLPIGALYPKSVALDLVQSRMFVTAVDGITTYNLDGLDPATVVGRDLAVPLAIALDDLRGKMYWTELGGVRRANLDGSDIEDLITRPEGVRELQGIVLDPPRRTMYFTDRLSGVKRASLSGEELQTLVTDTWLLHGVAFDSRAPGDWNDDGAVDLRELALFQNCFTGEGAAQNDSACSFFDLYPADHDVDLADFAGFIQAFSTD